LSAHTVIKKSFPLFGKVVDVNWKGNDHDTGLVRVFSNDKTVTNLATKIGNLRVRSLDLGWTLRVDRRLNPTNQDWQTIQKIADYILLSPRRL